MSSTENNSYCTGSVSDYVGGLVGENIYNSTVSNSYYNAETSGQTDSGKGEPLTTEQMKQSSSFNT